MTPMIDVIFLLLIFFVCTANFTPLEEILPMNTTLPGSVPSEVLPPDLANLDAVVVQIVHSTEQGGRLYWQIEGNRCATLGEVQNLLRSVHSVKPDIPVVIEPENDVFMENVIDVYDVCRQVGLLQIQFSVGEP